MNININFPLLDEKISFSDSNILVLESNRAFSKICQYLYQFDYQDDLKIFDNRYNNLKGSDLLIISDIYSYDVNSASILKLLYADIEEQLNQKLEVKSMIEKLSATITELISYELLEQDLDLEYDEITILELIKALGVKIEVKSDTLYEKVFEILKIFKFLPKKKLLIFQNVGAYFTNTEIENILEYSKLANINLLFLEPRKLYNFNQYILDEDYFLSYQKADF